VCRYIGLFCRYIELFCECIGNHVAFSSYCLLNVLVAHVWMFRALFNFENTNSQTHGPYGLFFRCIGLLCECIALFCAYVRSHLASSSYAKKQRKKACFRYSLSVLKPDLKIKQGKTGFKYSNFFVCKKIKRLYPHRPDLLKTQIRKERVQTSYDAKFIIAPDRINLCPCLKLKVKNATKYS